MENLKQILKKKKDNNFKLLNIFYDHKIEGWLKNIKESDFNEIKRNEIMLFSPKNRQIFVEKLLLTKELEKEILIPLLIEFGSTKDIKKYMEKNSENNFYDLENIIELYSYIEKEDYFIKKQFFEETKDLVFNFNQYNQKTKGNPLKTGSELENERFRHIWIFLAFNYINKNELLKKWDELTPLVYSSDKMFNNFSVKSELFWSLGVPWKLPELYENILNSKEYHYLLGARPDMTIQKSNEKVISKHALYLVLSYLNLDLGHEKCTQYLSDVKKLLDENKEEAKIYIGLLNIVGEQKTLKTENILSFVDNYKTFIKESYSVVNILRYIIYEKKDIKIDDHLIELEKSMTKCSKDDVKELILLVNSLNYKNINDIFYLMDKYNLAGNTISGLPLDVSKEPENILVLLNKIKDKFQSKRLVENIVLNSSTFEELLNKKVNMFNFLEKTLSVFYDYSKEHKEMPSYNFLKNVADSIVILESNSEKLFLYERANVFMQQIEPKMRYFLVKKIDQYSQSRSPLFSIMKSNYEFEQLKKDIKQETIPLTRNKRRI